MSNKIFKSKNDTTKKMKWKYTFELINEKRCSPHFPLKRNIVKISSIIENENEELSFNKSLFVKVFVESWKLQVVTFLQRTVKHFPLIFQIRARSLICLKFISVGIKAN